MLYLVHVLVQWKACDKSTDCLLGLSTYIGDPKKIKHDINSVASAVTVHNRDFGEAKTGLCHSAIRVRARACASAPIDVRVGKIFTCCV